MKKVFTVSSIVCVAVIAIMALFVYGRDHLGPLEMMMKQEVMAEGTQSEKTAETSDVYLGIPLPDGTSDADVSIENRYMDQSIVVTIQNAAVEDYDGRVLNGSSDHIESVYYDVEGQAVQIHIVLDELCEYELNSSGRELQLTLTPVREIYDKVIVIDAGHGGSISGTASYGISEKDVTLAIAEKLKQLLDQTDIRVYYTRLSDVDVSQEERTRIAELSDADMYISIHANADAQSHVPTGITTCYHRGSSGQSLTNQTLAEELQKAVVSSTKANDRGVTEDTTGIALLQELKGPAVMLQAGYLTNRQDALLLASTPYQEKVAEGIYTGIVQAYKKLGKTVNR